MGKISLAWIFCQMAAWKIGRTNGQNGSTTTVSTEAFGVWSIFRFSSYHHLLRAGASRASRPGCGSAQAWRRWRHMTRSEEVEEDCCDTIDLNASCVWTSWVHVTLYHVDPPHKLTACMWLRQSELAYLLTQQAAQQQQRRHYSLFSRARNKNPNS